MNVMPDKLPGEGMRAYCAFRVYCEAGPDRSIRNIRQKAGRSRAVMERWSKAHGWVTRAEIYDQNVFKAKQEADEAALKAESAEWARKQLAFRKERFEISMAWLRKAEEMLRFPVAKQTTADGKTEIKPGRWTFYDAVKMQAEALKMQALCLGLPTDSTKTEVTGPEGAPISSGTIVILPHNGRDLEEKK